PQATLFYPPAWLMLLAGVGPGVGWLALVHLWLGGWGMAAFARQLGASRGGALAGGIVYEFSALMGAHLDAGHLNYLLCQAGVAGAGRSVSPVAWPPPGCELRFRESDGVAGGALHPGVGPEPFWLAARARRWLLGLAVLGGGDGLRRPPAPGCLLSRQAAPG